MLERDAPYVQIIEHYRRLIAAGQLQDGDLLPSGREIAAEFGVSIATAAKVATGLQALGLVTPRPGAGTMVAPSRTVAWRRRSTRPSGPTARDIAESLGVGPLERWLRRRQATVREGATAAVLTS